ncbi:MAG: rhomboid family intramembrane serine protease [Candidatus Hydrogenedentes bacterium]|nr:rhomboid family intramembrane serine protease [Candidatus Hydrogenedentota bacterium]
MSSYYYTEQKAYGGYDYRITRAVQRLILLNSAVFAVQLLLDVPLGGVAMFGPPGGLIAENLSFQPVSFLVGMVWQPVTYMFLHGNLMHVFFNMLWLYFFGPDVERALGTRQFVVFYLLCGALGVMATFVPLVFQVALPFLQARNVSVVGASGAVMGVMIAFAIVNPHRQFFMFPIPVPINARMLVAIVIVINLLNAAPGSPTSVATHFGGMAVGYAYMKFIPYFRDRQRTYWQSRRKPPKKDSAGEQVDNIFHFDKHKRN